MSCARLAGIVLLKSWTLCPFRLFGTPSVALMTCALRLRKFCATRFVPGLPELSAATTRAFSQESLNCQCMLPCGNTVACSFLSVPAISWLFPAFTRPSSSTVPNLRFDPSTRIRNSAARGCIWGVLMLQGLRNSTVRLRSRPTENG
jgi:hypothetical protein